MLSHFIMQLTVQKQELEEEKTSRKEEKLKFEQEKHNFQVLIKRMHEKVRMPNLHAGYSHRNC